MDQRQHNPRYAAARAFIESLDQLQETLQSADSQPVQPTMPSEIDQQSRTDSPSSDSFDLSSFEQAAADIEQFIQKRQADDEG